MNATEGFKRIALALSIFGWLAAIVGTALGVSALNGHLQFDSRELDNAVIAWGLLIMGWVSLVVIQLGLWITRGFFKPKQSL